MPIHSTSNTPIDRLAFILNAADIGTWDLDIINQQVWWDERCKRMYGFQEDDIVPYQQVLRYMHPDDAGRVHEAVRRALDPQSMGQFAIQFRILGASDGQLRWLHCKGQAFFNDQRVAYRFSGIAQEVTQLTQTNQQLDRSEARFEDLVMAIPTATAVFTGRDMLIQQVNAPMLAIWGKDESVLGKTLHVALPELESQPFLAQLQHVFDTGKPFRNSQGIAELIQNGQRKTVWFNHAYNPLYDAQGQIYGVINTATDITGQVHAQQATEESQQQLLALFEQSPVAIALISKDGLTFQTANPFYGSLVGRKPEELIGKPLLEVLPELRGQGFEDLLNDVITTGRPFIANEVRAEIVRHEQLETLYVDLTYQPRREASGPISGILVVATDVTAQVSTRQQIEKQTAQFQQLLDNTPDVITRWDKDGRLLFANRAFVEQTNQDRAQLLGKTNREMEQPNPLTRPYGASLQRVLETGQPQDHTQAFPTRNGKAFFHSRLVPEFGPEGKVESVLIVARDVTHEVVGRQQLEASEARFRTLIEQAPVATCLFVGRELRIEVANEAMIQVWGKGTGVLGQPLLNALPELKDQVFPSLLERLYTTGESYEAKTGRADLVVGGALQTFYFNYAFKPLKDNQGAVYAILESAVDVTQQVLDHQQLQQAEQSLREAIELAQLGTWTLDPVAGRFNYSDRLREWTGDEAVVALETAFEAIDPADRERIRAALAYALTPQSGGVFNEQYRLSNRQTAQQRILHAQGQTDFDEQGNALKLSGATRDSTQAYELQLALEQQVQARTLELQLANSDLKRSNDNLQQFAYIASHDLQEPLRKIQSFSSLLAQQFSQELPESGLDYIKRITSAGARMSTLIKDLLTYSRISTRQQVFGPVSLDAVLAGVLYTLDLTITERGAQLELTELPVVKGDELQLSQLFQNLLSNAIKFTPAEQTPRLAIRFSRRHRSELPAGVHPTSEADFYYQISVQDQGIGFDEKYLDRIFQVFQRLHGKSEFPGTGVGLAICQRVAENHGGAITAVSQPGKGATFCVYLPG